MADPVGWSVEQEMLAGSRGTGPRGLAGGGHADARGRARRRVLRRDLAVIVGVALVVGLASQVRFLANPARPPAVALTERLDEVYRDHRAGAVSLTREPREVAPGVLGAEVDEERWAVAGEVDDTCYAMWWGPEGRRRVRTVPTLLSCEPRTAGSFREDTVASSGLAAGPGRPRAHWDAILPDRTSVHAWWIPLLVVAGGLVLAAGVRIVIVLVTGQTSRDLR